MIILSIILSLAAIGFFCWLLFTLAVFALPFFAGLPRHVGLSHGRGFARRHLRRPRRRGATFGLGQIAMAFLPAAWLRLLIILLFVAPATVAGYTATHGIAQMAMPSATWQMIFSMIGAIAVSVTAFVRFTGMASPGPSGPRMARV